MIKDEYSELTSQYDNFIKECETLARDEILEKAEKLLQDMRESGKVISEPEQRGVLFDKAKVLGRTVFEISGIYPVVRLKQPLEKIEFATEFMDRLNEMHYITNIYCPPYLLLSAPMEYGKTRLVQAVTERLQKQNWFCIHVELWRQKPYSVKELTYNILQELGDAIGVTFRWRVSQIFALFFERHDIYVTVRG